MASVYLIKLIMFTVPCFKFYYEIYDNITLECDLLLFTILMIRYELFLTVLVSVVVDLKTERECNIKYHRYNLVLLLLLELNISHK